MIRKVKTKLLPVAEILVGKRWRAPQADQVSEMRQSLRHTGQLSSIGVRAADREKGETGSPWVLVFGATRLVAAREEGWAKIRAAVLKGSDVDFEIAELVENLHRGELSKLDRDRQLVRYLDLMMSGEVLRGARAKPTGGRPRGGLREAARQLGIPESTVRDALKAATITDEGARAVTDLGLADKPASYRKVARERTPEAQVAKAREIDNRIRDRGRNPGAKSSRGRYVALMAAWSRAGAEVREEFLRRIGHGSCHGGTSRLTNHPRHVRPSTSSPMRRIDQLELEGPGFHRPCVTSSSASGAKYQATLAAESS